MSENGKFYALLIGIDHYREHRLEGGIYYPKLSGCVPDINRVEAFLQEKVEPDEIIKLTATNVVGPNPSEPEEVWPTYENMAQALKTVINKAGEGDQVYIHYSGHGGRSPTIYADKKGAGTQDESLVPMDIGEPDTRYLRDLELAAAFKKMVDKGVYLTVVFDSCHSGGTTRNADVGVRGIEEIDPTVRPTGSLVVSEEELTDTWDSLTEGQTRAFKPAGDWLPHPEGYTLLAACEPQEKAHETRLDDGTRGGVFTYWVIDSMQQIGPGLNYRMVHNRVLPKVHTRFKQQTPMLQGEGDRAVFGVTKVPEIPAVNVSEVDTFREQVQLATGQVQAVTKGAQFHIYPANTDFTEVEKRKALVEIAQLGAASSWAKIVKDFDQGAIKVGDQAAAVHPGKVRLVHQVRVLHRPAGELPAGEDQDAALARIETAVQDSSLGWIELAAEGAETDYLVDLDDDGAHYRILDKPGEPIPNIRPALQVDDAQAPARVAERLVHLTKFSNLVELENGDPNSPLRRALDIELLKAPPDFEPGEPMEGTKYEGTGPITLSVGDWAFMRIKNRSQKTINIAVLDLDHAWGIQQVFPQGADYEPLDPGAQQVFPLQAYLPEDYDEGAGVLKVFATVSPASFRWTELPNLDKGNTRSWEGASTRAAANPLEKMLAAFTDEKATTRAMNPATVASHGWATEQLKLLLKKA